MTKPLTRNTLFYGDNLDIMREHIPDESVDLIYLDPPFNSNRSYNVLFKDESGKDSESQITAFEDTWHWGEDAQKTYHELVQGGPANVATMISALRQFIGANQMMAYLVMMTARLIELHRVLKSTGSIYLHCDPTASHYLKVVMDAVFGILNFRNEIIWKRATAHSDAKTKFADVADIILFYVRSKAESFTPQYGKHDPNYLEQFYKFDDNDGRGPYSIDNMASPNPRPNMMYEWMGFPCPAKGWRYQRETMQKLHDEGRIWYPTKADGSFDYSRRPRLKRYLKEQEGSIVTNIWDDIQALQSVSHERLGYPTQKPLALLERIIQASSNEGDVVLDPFCGCGTAIAAAQKLNRKWIGIDITHLSIALMKYRLKDSFSLVEKKDYDVIGEPESLGGARQLAKDNRYQFQWWAGSLLHAMPLGGESGSREGKKGSDRGVDGVINFVDEKDKTQRVLVQVKSGHVTSRDVRDLRGTVEREGAAIGVFVTLEDPSKDMVTEAVSAGYYHSKLWQKDYPRIQILTVEQLMEELGVNMPPTDHRQTFKQAEKIKKKDATQDEMF